MGVPGAEGGDFPVEAGAEWAADPGPTPVLEIFNDLVPVRAKSVDRAMVPVPDAVADR